MGTLLTTTNTLAADYAGTLIESVIVLAVTAAVAYLAVRFLAARGFVAGRGKPLQLEQSFRLDAKSSLVIVEIEGRRLLLATHVQAPPRLLLELEHKSEGGADA